MVSDVLLDGTKHVSSDERVLTESFHCEGAFTS